MSQLFLVKVSAKLLARIPGKRSLLGGFDGKKAFFLKGLGLWLHGVENRLLGDISVPFLMAF